jgi:hypothetical protein
VDVPTGRGRQAGEDAQQGGLATAGWTDEGDDLGVVDLEVDRAEGGDRAGAVAEALLDGGERDGQASASSRRSFV